MIFADDLINSGQDYNIEIQFPGANYLTVWWIRTNVISNCRKLGFAAHWKISLDDTWFLNYRLLDQTRVITHQEFFDQVVIPVCDYAVWTNKVESGQKEGLLTGSGLFEWLEKYWWVAIGLFVFIMVVPIFYRRN
ncbi:unnamed protein product [marine sediment metagenome]|uniref:Uncharacterized protein n=1 Tax=marine sediment metagenome TaxID=412755 RepID=X1TLN6_9ZZZZ